jgi:predicted ATPase
MAAELGHPFSLAEIVLFAGCLLSLMRSDARALTMYAEELARLARDDGMPTWRSMRDRYVGSAMAIRGDATRGIALMRAGIEADESRDLVIQNPTTLCAVAEAQARVGSPADGLATVAEALAMFERSDERNWEAEIWRVRGELLLKLGDEAGAEASFLKAIEVARRQQAKSWELRASVSLARLWIEQGKADKARRMLAEVYSWFTEGFDTPDLREAASLLHGLPCPKAPAEPSGA